jgi:hypothetical protein
MRRERLPMGRFAKRQRFVQTKTLAAQMRAKPVIFGIKTKKKAELTLGQVQQGGMKRKERTLSTLQGLG